MGLVRADVRLYNDGRSDIEEIDAKALVDTGALHLSVPEHVAKRLKLEKRYDREVVFADGRRATVAYCSGVRVETGGRGCVVGALVFGDEVLLGAIPTEDMDLIVHPARLEVIPNPASPDIAVSLAVGYEVVNS